MNYISNYPTLLFNMPQKKTNKRAKNSKNKNSGTKPELVFKEDGQEYAQVLRILGGLQLEVFCYDGNTRIAHIRGKMRKRNWVRLGDIILVSLRDFQNGYADVIHKYQYEEAKQLKTYKELPSNARLCEGMMDITADTKDDCVFEFDDI